MTPRSTLHQKILHDIEGRIVSGEWPRGFRLPFEVELAKSYQVSRMTVNKVLTKLADAGLIERRRKGGSFVASPQIQAAILEIHDIEEEVRQLQCSYHFKLLHTRSRKASDGDRLCLDLQKNEDIMDLSCLHFAGDMPFCHEARLINLGTVPKAADINFATTPPGRWLQNQVPWSTAEHKISAMVANASLAKLLKLPEQAPCLIIERRTWNDQGAVTYARFSYWAEKHAVVAKFTPTTSSRR